MELLRRVYETKDTQARELKEKVDTFYERKGKIGVRVLGKMKTTYYPRDSRQGTHTHGDLETLLTCQKGARSLTLSGRKKKATC